jgi:hypothetical protein
LRGIAAVQFDQMLFAKIDIFCFRARHHEPAFEQRAKRFSRSGKLIRSCGRLGPATLGCTSAAGSDRYQRCDFALKRHAKHFLRLK